MNSNSRSHPWRTVSLALALLTVLATAIVLSVAPAAGESQQSAIDEAVIEMIQSKGAFTKAPIDSSSGVTGYDRALDEATEGSAEISINNATGYASFIRFRQGLTVIHAPQGGASSVAQADAFFIEYGEVFGITNPAAELNYVGTSVDNYGNSHVTYHQVYKGLPVFAGVLKVHLNDSKAITAVNGTFVPDIMLNTRPDLSAEEAGQIAVNAVARQSESQMVSNDLSTVGSVLMVYRTGLVQRVEGKNHLVYEVEVTNSAITVREFVYVDAHTGAIVDQITGIFAGLDREVSESSLANVIWDESEAGLHPDPIPPGWAMGTAQQITDWQNEIDGARETYNLFASMAGWDSYDNTGSTMRTVNNDPGINCPNANWNGISTNYCSGVTGDDTVAHEWGHAYTQFTNDLIYAWQSGALNESYSDIWGDAVDLLNGRGTDTPGGLRSDGGCSIYGQGTPSIDDSYRWLSGEDDPAFGGAIRDLWNPVCYGDPGKVTDTEYWCSSGDAGGVHTNSGVPNHAFALMVDGGTYNAQTVTGIGLTKASHIHWGAQNMLTVGSIFVDQADALEASCAALTGINLPALSTSDPNPGLSGEIITLADCQEVSDAIAATELRTPPDQCGFEPAWTDVPPLCEGQGTGQVNSILYQDWEAGQGNWITGTHDIANPVSFDNPDWVVRGALPDRTGDAMYVEDSINRGACTPADTVAGALNLDSPPIVIPADALVPRVAIDHYVSTEAGWDGGNLKVGVNGGPLVVVPDSAMDYNGYFAPGAINGGGNDNPLGGEEGWTGGGEGSVATGWGQTQVNLLGFAGPGDTVELRFDMGLDGCNGVDGWYVDEVEVYSCTDEELPPCGDGILDLGESCDDGNSADGDGCSSVCQVEDDWICSDPTPPDPNGTNVVADWSFEGGVPNTDWTATSTYGGIPGFPLCGPDNGCLAAGLATTGVWNVWIGGLSSGVTSSVEQSVTIPATASDLTVQTLRGICDDPSDTLHVSLDGSDIGTVVCDATDGDFVEQTFSVAGYNDDAAHNLYIGGTVGGTNGTHTNFFVDDVTISDNVGTDGSPSVCTPIQSDLVCNDGEVGFEGGIPDTWTIVDNEGTGVVWTGTGIQGYPDDCGEGNYTNGSGEAACASSHSFGAAELDTELWSNPFSLTSYESVTLTYTANYQNFTNEDFFDLDVSSNGGITWTNLLSWNEDHGSFHSPPGEDVTIDLSAYAGMSDLILRWHYYDPNAEDWDWYVQVDDVSLSCTFPEIDVDPGSLESIQYPDRVVTLPMSVNNTGTAVLDWTIVEAASVMHPIADSPRPPAYQVFAGDLGLIAAPGDAAGEVQPAARAPDSLFTLTHSLSQTIVANNSVACGAGGLHADNSHLRYLDLTSFGIVSDFGVASVEIGIQTANGANSTQPASMNLYLWDPADPFTFANFNLIGSSPVTVDDSDAMTIIAVPVVATAPAGSTLVVEFFNPEGQTAGSGMWVGSNPYEQTAPTYLASAVCGAPEPTDVAQLDFPGMHLVMNVNGSADCSPPGDIPWASANPTAGSTTAGGGSLVDVTFDSTGYGTGVYTGELCVFSNDPINPIVPVPISMTVYEPAVSGFSGSPTSGLVPLPVDFVNESSGDFDSCSWDFGDGNTSTNCADPSNKYTASGVYDVSLTVSGLGGTDTETKTGYITVVDFSYLPVISKPS